MKKGNYFWFAVLLIFISGTLMATQSSDEAYLEKLQYKTEHEFYTNNLSVTNNHENVRNYCDSFWSNATDDWITNVTFNTIDNTTGQEGGDPSYGDYTAISTDVNAGDTYTFSMSWESTTWTEYGAVWFDWNQDEDFLDAGEEYQIGSGASVTVTIDILIPADATPGATRMRVSERWNAEPEPCNESAAMYGETEDYTVVIGGGTPPGYIEGNITLDGGTGNVEDVVVTAGTVTVNPDAMGDYEISIAPGTYDVMATLMDYDDATALDVVVTEGNYTSGIDLTLVYNTTIVDPPENLMVTDEGYATWDPPAGSILDEFRYDDGVITAQLGFGDLPSAVLGASHPNDAVIEEVTWYLTSEAVHPEAIIYIFGLQPDGTPDTAQLLHESAVLPNVDDAWNTYTLATPLSAPAGFFIGVNTPMLFTAIGTDDGVGAPWEFQLGTQWGIADWTAGNDWLDVGPAGFPLNFSIRAYGTDMGPLALAPRNDTPVNHANSGLIYSELDTPVNTNSSLNRDLLGYNLYLDGVFVEYTTDLFYQYLDLAGGTTYLAEVTALYDDGESDPIGYTFTTPGGGLFDPPENVSVDEELGAISWYPPANTLIFDDIDAYAPGDYIAEVGDDWTTWSNAPGGAEDALVTDAQASSPSNSVVVELNQDLVLIMEDYTSGVYSYEMKMFVPTGYCGYFNLQKTSTPGEEWAFQIYYQTDGMAYADMAAAAAYSHPFNHDEWMDLKVIVDLDSDWATYFFNGEEIGGYQWTLGTFGTAGLLQFGGVNIFGGANATTTDTPMFYFDDVKLTELVPATDDLLGYNVYLDNVMQNTGVVTDLEYTYAGLVDGETYDGGVSAVYDDGESDIVEVEFTYTPQTSFDPPNNPMAVVDDYNDVVLTWELPGGAVEEIAHHTGYDANGIGTGGAVDFICAARFDAVELADYYGGWEITGVNITLNSLDFDYVAIQVYEGGSIGDPGTLVYDEEITSSAVMGEVTPHLLTSPVPLVAGNEYWLGYDMGATADHPAGCDAGPMVPEKGGWMYFNSAWQTLPELSATLDYNWCITGIVSQSDAIASKGAKRSEVIGRTHGVSSRGTLEAEYTREIGSAVTPLRNSRSLAGYKIYRDGTMIMDISDPAILTYTDESLDEGTYEYTLLAYYTNPEGESDLVGPVSATVVLEPPVNAEAVSFGPLPSISVTWNAPGRGVDHYNVYRDGEFQSEEVSTSYLDTGVLTGNYVYNITAVYEGDYESDYSNDAEVDHVDGDNILLPTVTKLTGNYPNPFNPSTTISFSLKEAGHVSVNIYNMRGQLVKTLVNAELDRNFHEFVWDGRDNSGKTTTSGVYFYKMKAQNYNSTKKMILMK